VAEKDHRHRHGLFAVNKNKISLTTKREAYVLASASMKRMLQAGVETQVSGSLNPVGWDGESKLLDIILRNSPPCEQH
jgi:hypothetical protein